MTLLRNLFVQSLPKLTLIILFLGHDLIFADTITTNVRGADKLTCRAHLHIPFSAKSRELPLVFSQAGTGLYETESEHFSPTLQYLYDKGKIAILTMDKPGIRFDPSEEEKVEVELDEFLLHTQTDLVACSINALNWAVQHDRISSKESVIMHGHSEGVQVFIRAYFQLLKENNPLHERMQLFILSGAPMMSWRTIIDVQWDETQKADFWSAFDRKDNDTLMKYGEVPYQYWENIFIVPSLSETLRELRELNPRARFHFFHGLDDTHTPARYLREAENENIKQKRDDKPSLMMSVRYYTADHYLSIDACNDMIFTILAFIEHEEETK